MNNTFNMGESLEYESDFEDEYESFEYEDEFAYETGNWEYESALDVLSPSELKAVRITSTFETGRPGSFGGLTGNFDGQGLSFGLLNFTIKAGSLIPLLQEFINKYPDRYSAAFGKDAERFKDIVFATKPDPTNPKRRVRDVERQMGFVNTQMNLIPKKAKGNRIVEPWKTYFSRLEKDAEFRKIQVKAVRRALDRARYWFDYFGFKTERGFAFMFDLVSSHGGAWLNAPKFKGKRSALLQKMLADKKAKLGQDALTELEKMEVIANMIANVSLPEWREEVRVRKMWFVRGSGIVHKTSFDIRKNFSVTDSAPDFGSSTSTSEFEWGSHYTNEEFEFEQNIMPVPALLGQPEKSSQGETFYVKIGIGKGLPASTGIYIPNYFKPDSDIAVVIYLHGYKSAYPGNAVLIKGYWDGTRFPFFALREEVAASGKNVIFVAPSLGPRSQAGSLIQRGGFDAFIKQVLLGLNEHYMVPRHGRRISDVQSIILAAHSGGGSPMLNIARGTDQYVKKIKECWCFDSMYGSVASAWLRWAKSHPNQSLHVYYGPAKGQYDPKTGKKHVLPRDNAEAIACEVRKQGPKNVCVQPSRAKPVGRVHAHFWVPKVHLNERLLNRPCLAGDICPHRQPRTHSELEVPASGPPAGGLTTPVSNLNTLRTNIVQIAKQEWERWNTPSKKFERDSRVRQILLDYWHSGPRVRVQASDLGSKAWQAEHPWSAAFISWVMRKAGAGSAFRYSSAHATYIKAAKDNRMANNANPFKAYRVTEVKPAVGDLVCKSRAGSGATYENIHRGMLTHCDIVTEVQPGRLTTIGGNVSSSVSKTAVTIDANGYINDPRYFAVIKLVPPSS